MLNPVETLASLITSNPSEAMELYVRIAAGSAWRKVHRVEEPVPTGRHELLDAIHLDAERCARWIDFRKRSDALDAAAIDEFRGVAIQTAVLTLAAVAEGLQRRLFDEKRSLPALSANDLKQARRAARTAALESVRELDRSDRTPLTDADLSELETAMNESFGSINEPTFRTRMADLAGSHRRRFRTSLRRSLIGQQR